MKSPRPPGRSSARRPYSARRSSRAYEARTDRPGTPPARLATPGGRQDAGEAGAKDTRTRRRHREATTTVVESRRKSGRSETSTAASHPASTSGPPQKWDDQRDTSSPPKHANESPRKTAPGGGRAANPDGTVSQ